MPTNPNSLTTADGDDSAPRGTRSTLSHPSTTPPTADPAARPSTAPRAPLASSPARGGRATPRAHLLVTAASTSMASAFWPMSDSAVDAMCDALSPASLICLS